MDPIFKPLLTDEEKVRRAIKRKFLKDNGDGTYDYLDNISLLAFYVKSMKSLPKIRNLEGFFHGAFNQLTSLEGGPDYVKYGFDCVYNQLTSLVGGPISVGYTLNCSNNPIETLKGMPKYIGWDFVLYNHSKANDFDWMESELRKYAGIIKQRIFVDEWEFHWNYDQKKLEKFKNPYLRSQ